MAARSTSGPLWLLVIAIAIGLALCYTGVFYQTGAQFYQSCWQKRHAAGKEPNSPEQAAQWGACEDTADAALFNAGFVFGGNPAYAVTPQLKALVAACPSNYSDIPISGAWSLAVQMIQDTGGPTPKDRFTPASSTIVRVFENKWPKCAATAASNGFPKLVKRNGSWDFEHPCVPCKDEEQAMQAEREHTEQKRREWEGMSEAQRQKELDKVIDPEIEAAFATSPKTTGVRGAAPTAAAGQYPEAETKK